MTADAQARLRELLETIRPAIRQLDCGWHYCRYCSAGTKNNWAHAEHCLYATSVKQADAAKSALAELDALVRASVTPPDQRFCDWCIASLTGYTETIRKWWGA